MKQQKFIWIMYERCCKMSVDEGESVFLPRGSAAGFDNKLISLWRPWFANDCQLDAWQIVSQSKMSDVIHAIASPKTIFIFPLNNVEIESEDVAIPEQLFFYVKLLWAHSKLLQDSFKWTALWNGNWITYYV